MYYDLHIHSALSPCSDDDMTLNNICHMAMLIGLDVIAITDHNSCKQLLSLGEITYPSLEVLLGVEIQTSEKIHLLAYFTNMKQIKKMQDYLDLHLIKMKNDTYYYGNQWLFDQEDQIIGQESCLLMNSLDVDASEVSKFVHQLKGTIILAHPYRKYGYFTIYPQIQEDLMFEGLEYSSIEERKEYEAKFVHKVFLKNSDAHHLYALSDKENELTIEQLNILNGGV